VAVTMLSSGGILWGDLPMPTPTREIVRAGGRFDWPPLGLLMPDAEIRFLGPSIVVLLPGRPVVGIRFSRSVTSEREKQTWEALLMSPLSAKQLVRSKLWGVMGASYWYLLAYVAPAAALAALGGWLALVWTVLGLAVTVLAMYFIGAAGIYC